MTETLRAILADACSATGALSPHTGGVEAAWAAGLLRDVDSVRAFLYARLWTTGAVDACAAAAVCARAPESRSLDSLLRSAEAEVDARTPSPVGRCASRQQGSLVLAAAVARIGPRPEFEALSRVAQQGSGVGPDAAALTGADSGPITGAVGPHQAVAFGAIGAVVGVRPEEAAEVAALAVIAGPVTAAGQLLGFGDTELEALGSDMAPEIRRLAGEAAEMSLRSLSEVPAFAAPTIDYLAEELWERQALSPSPAASFSPGAEGLAVER